MVERVSRAGEAGNAHAVPTSVPTSQPAMATTTGGKLGLRCSQSAGSYLGGAGVLVVRQGRRDAPCLSVATRSYSARFGRRDVISSRACLSPDRAVSGVVASAPNQTDGIAG
jgi:hypothetical protein